MITARTTIGRRQASAVLEKCIDQEEGYRGFRWSQFVNDDGTPAGQLLTRWYATSDAAIRAAELAHCKTERR